MSLPKPTCHSAPAALQAVACLRTFKSSPCCKTCQRHAASAALSQACAAQPQRPAQPPRQPPPTLPGLSKRCPHTSPRASDSLPKPTSFNEVAYPWGPGLWQPCSPRSRGCIFVAQPWKRKPYPTNPPALRAAPSRPPHAESAQHPAAPAARAAPAAGPPVLPAQPPGRWWWPHRSRRHSLHAHQRILVLTAFNKQPPWELMNTLQIRQ